MSSHNKKQASIIQISLLVTIILGLIFAFSNISSLIFFLLLLLSWSFIISLYYPKLGLFLFILLRPILDFSTYQSIFNLGSFSLNLAAIHGLMLIIFAFFAIYPYKHKLKKLPLLWPWLAFLILSALSIFGSINVGSSLEEMSRLLGILAMLLLGYTLLHTKKDLTNFIKVIIASALIPALVALAQFINKTGLYDDGAGNRLFGTFAHPNMLGFFLVLISSLSLFAYLKNRKEKIETNLYGLLTLFFIFLLVFTFARGAWLALVIFLIIIGILRFRIMLVSAVLLSIVLYISILPLQQRVDSIIEPQSYGSIEWRLQLWQDEWRYFQQQPITGHGLGTASQVIFNDRGPRFGSSEPHNDYLKVAIESGALALVAYLWLIIQSSLLLFISYLKQHRPKLKFFKLFVFGAIVGIFVMSFGDNVLNDTALQWSIWSLLGGILRTTK